MTTAPPQLPHVPMVFSAIAPPLHGDPMGRHVGMTLTAEQHAVIHVVPRRLVASSDPVMHFPTLIRPPAAKDQTPTMGTPSAWVQRIGIECFSLPYRCPEPLQLLRVLP